MFYPKKVVFSSLDSSMDFFCVHEIFMSIKKNKTHKLSYVYVSFVS